MTHRTRDPVTSAKAPSEKRERGEERGTAKERINEEKGRNERREGKRKREVRVNCGYV